MPQAGSEGGSQEIINIKMFPYTIPNSTYLHKYAPKSMAEPPDLACGHFLEPGAGSVRVSQKK